MYTELKKNLQKCKVTDRAVNPRRTPRVQVQNSYKPSIGTQTTRECYDYYMMFAVKKNKQNIRVIEGGWCGIDAGEYT